MVASLTTIIVAGARDRGCRSYGVCAAVALGIDWALYILHPDLFNFETLMQNVDDFYTLVYGKTFTAEQLGIE